MQKTRSYNYLKSYLDELQASGQYSFSLEQLSRVFTQHSADALKLSLYRQSKAGRIRSVHKGFYVIIPAEYPKRKSIPPEFYIDKLFTRLNRKYYFSLFTAAAYHGATHQQIMESYICIEKPPLRKSEKQPVVINYIVKSDFPRWGIVKMKNKTGYFNVSGPELTALDLIRFHKTAGGMNRVIGLITEMQKSLTAESLKNTLNSKFPAGTLQRAGYIFDTVLNRADLAETIVSALSGKTLYPVPLELSGSSANTGKNAKWKIIENCDIDLETP